jgi:5-formyltetrahydrofolate cyclo-ligase
MPPEHHGFIPSSADEQMRVRVKAELRKRMRALRKALPASACAARSALIADRLATLEPVTRARTVCLFWPIEDRHEVDLRPLDARLRERGVRVAYPGVDPEGGGGMTFRFVADPELMERHAFGFREPSVRDPEAEQLDVIIVPALAIDPRGHRIGYGAGYYDRALPRFVPPSVTVAVAFDFQLVVETPNSPVDLPVAWIVTDTRSMAAES